MRLAAGSALIPVNRLTKARTSLYNAISRDNICMFWPQEFGRSKPGIRHYLNMLQMALIGKLCTQALVYVSTAYSQCPQSEIEEKIYPMDLELAVEGGVKDGENGTKYR
jgi:hypothetical protein